MSKQLERTRESFVIAFRDLLEQKPYEEITMTAIAARANRTRVTLYRHYASKQELLIDCFWQSIELVKEKVILLHEPTESHSGEFAFQNLVVLFTQVAANRPLYKALLYSSDSIVIRTQLRRFITGIVLIFWEQDGTLAALPHSGKIAASLLAESFLGSIVWWLDSGTKYAPEQMANIVLRLVETGFLGLAGKEAQPKDWSFIPFDDGQYE